MEEEEDFVTGKIRITKISIKIYRLIRQITKRGSSLKI